jgi:hypothetical protein
MPATSESHGVVDQADRDAAIRERARNVLIDAGAGTGKTPRTIEKHQRSGATVTGRCQAPVETVDKRDRVGSTRQTQSGAEAVGLRDATLVKFLACPPGTTFTDRAAVAKAGVHRPTVAGISGGEKEGADSIVISGGYEDDEDFGDEIIYTGHEAEICGIVPDDEDRPAREVLSLGYPRQVG